MKWLVVAVMGAACGTDAPPPAPRPVTAADLAVPACDRMHEAFVKAARCTKMAETEIDAQRASWAADTDAMRSLPAATLALAKQTRAAGCTAAAAGYAKLLADCEQAHAALPAARPKQNLARSGIDPCDAYATQIESYLTCRGIPDELNTRTLDVYAHVLLLTKRWTKLSSDERTATTVICKKGAADMRDFATRCHSVD